MKDFSVLACLKRASSIFVKHTGSILVVHGIPYMLFLVAGGLIVEGRGVNMEGVSAVFLALSVLGAFFAQVVLIVLFDASFEEQSFDWADLLGKAWRSCWGFWLCSIIYCVMVSAGLFFLVLPGIWLALNFVFMMHGVVLRKKNIWESMVYSKSLIDKSWGQMLLLLGFLFSAVFIMALLGKWWPWFSAFVLFFWIPYMLSVGVVSFRMLEGSETV